MSVPLHKPVIFLAFANDRDDAVSYLRNLPNEARRLREVLESAEQAGLCEVVVRTNSTTADIFKVFQDPKYRNRVAIFHYGGHANGFQLLLESAEGLSVSADAGGLAAFMAQQQGLQLMFLNGCSTQPQTQGLLDATISVVLSTSRAIDDKVATDFALQFYQGLAGGATIRTAYHEAAASLQTAHGNNTRGLYFGTKVDAKIQSDADRWPWNLYVREGSESADQWNLPEAVNDPLFGLPPLPKRDLPESPYRHLNWFTRKDAEVFFGRGHQIRELYDRLTAPHTAPIILFYGQSGVGKSSVLDAGLIPRLEQAYEVRYLRRAAGGLLDTLQRAFLPEADDVPVEMAWRVKEVQIRKPLFVFLDQVEELYTRPIADVTDEFEQLLKVVKATFCDPQCRPQGKLVLSFRKEWLAELETQLAAYELPRTKIFLEALDRRGIIEVVRGPALSTRLHERYGLTVEEGIAEIIADNLIEDRESAIAPTLQILLTKMWAKAIEANYEHPQFKQELYLQLKRDGILLRDFLNQQIAAFRERNLEAVDSGLLLDILAQHTTTLRTADQRSIAHLAQQYAHLGNMLPELLQQCLDLYLLTIAAGTQKESTKTTRLAHDTLAPLVREQFDLSDKPGQRARRILDSRSVDWDKDRAGMPLDEADLKIVELGIDGTRALSATEQRMMKASRELQARVQRNRVTLKILAAISLVVIAGLAGFGWWARSLANQRASELERANNSNMKQLHKASMADYARAVNAWKEDNNAELERRMAPSVGDASKWHEAIAYWSRALEIEPSNFQASSYLFEILLRIGKVKHFPLNEFQLEKQEQYKASFCPSGERLLIVSQNGTARVYDATGTILGPPIEHLIFPPTLSPDGTRLISAIDNDWTQIFDVASGKPLAPPVPTKAPVESAIFTNDGTFVATTFRDKVQIWNVATGAAQGEPLTRHFTSEFATFSPDGNWVVTASSFTTAQVWNAKSGKPEGTPLVHTDEVEFATFSPDGKWLVTASGKNARVWIANSGDPKGDLDHGYEVNFVTFSPDGTQIVTVSDDSIRCWSADTLELAWESSTHVGGLGVVRFSPCGDFIVAGNRDGIVRTWNRFGRPIGKPFPNGGEILDLTFSKDGTKLMTICTENKLRVWEVGADCQEGEPLRHDGIVTSAAFNSDGTRIVTTYNGYFARIWDTNTGLPIGNPIQTNPASIARVSPDGARIITVSDKNIVQFWSSEKGVPIGSPLELLDSISIESFSNDGMRVVISSSSEKKLVRVWDTNTGKPTGPPIKISNNAMIASLGPDGSRVVTACYNSDTGGIWDVQIWDVNSGKPLGKVLKHKDCVEAASLSPDGNRVITVTSDNNWTAQIWDATTGNPVGRPIQHEKYVKVAKFSPDGSYVITGGLDNMVRIWYANTGEPLGPPVHQVSTVYGASFSPDCSRIAIQLNDRIVLWDVGMGVEAKQISPDVIAWTQAVAGLRFDDNGELETIPNDMRRAVLQSPNLQAKSWADMAAWLGARGSHRTISPRSKVTLREIANRERDFGSLDSLESSLKNDPTVPLARMLLANLIEKDAVLNGGGTLDAAVLARAAHWRKYDLDRLPDDAKLWARAADILRQLPEAQVGVGPQAVTAAEAAAQADRRTAELEDK